MFRDAAQMSPEDADVHIVLGVLCNLSREYDKAIESFQTALKLKPRDYSLWNKLGATQANSVQSSDAIVAYQQVGFSCCVMPRQTIVVLHTSIILGGCLETLFYMNSSFPHLYMYAFSYPLHAWAFEHSFTILFHIPALLNHLFCPFNCSVL